MMSKFSLEWTDLTINGFEPPSLSSLVRRFLRSGCVNKLDHVYALLSLAQNGHEFHIDYNIDIETLFRRTMIFCMENKSLDELLLDGAALIEALELRPFQPPPTLPNIGEAVSSEGESAIINPGGPHLLVKYDPSMLVASPVWGEALLHTADASGHQLSREAYTLLISRNMRRRKRPHLRVCCGGERGWSCCQVRPRT
jgi:hypothetical protein